MGGYYRQYRSKQWVCNCDKSRRDRAAFLKLLGYSNERIIRSMTGRDPHALGQEFVDPGWFGDAKSGYGIKKLYQCDPEVKAWWDELKQLDAHLEKVASMERVWAEVYRLKPVRLFRRWLNNDLCHQPSNQLKH